MARSQIGKLGVQNLAARCIGASCLAIIIASLCGGCAEPSGGVASSDAAGPAGGQRSGTIRVTGSSTIAPLMAEIGKRFEAINPLVRVEVQTGGSSRGIADARRELNDIGMVSRALNPDELDLHHFPIARDGVCVILHSENPVAELTVEQIAKIYTGAIRNWRDVGGSDHAITVVNKADGRSTLEVFTEFFHLQSDEIRADVIIGDNAHGIKTVAGNPYAIGYVSIGTAAIERDSGVPIKLLPIHGVEASVQNVAAGRFPISRTLNLVTKTPPSGLVRELLDLAQSPRVHEIVEELSFVPAEN